MPLGREVGLGPGHIVLGGDPASPTERGTAASPLSHCIRINRSPCLLWPNGWMDPDITSYGDRPRLSRHCVKWGPSSRVPCTERKTAAPTFWNMSIVAKRSPISAAAELLNHESVDRRRQDEASGHLPCNFPYFSAIQSSDVCVCVCLCVCVCVFKQ